MYDKKEKKFFREKFGPNGFYKKEKVLIWLVASRFIFFFIFPGMLQMVFIYRYGCFALYFLFIRPFRRLLYFFREHSVLLSNLLWCSQWSFGKIQDILHSFCPDRRLAKWLCLHSVRKCISDTPLLHPMLHYTSSSDATDNRSRERISDTPNAHSMLHDT